jgi:lipoate-protein ligase A
MVDLSEEEQTYPPEDMLQEDFIRSIEEAETEIKEGKSRRYSREEFKKEFLTEVD